MEAEITCFSFPASVCPCPSCPCHPLQFSRFEDVDDLTAFLSGFGPGPNIIYPRKLRKIKSHHNLNTNRESRLTAGCRPCHHGPDRETREGCRNDLSPDNQDLSAPIA